MIKLSFRDVDKEFNLSPEEAAIKSQLMDSLSTNRSDEAYSEFIHSVNSEVSQSIDDYLMGLYEKDPRYIKLQQIDSLWDQLPLEVKQGKVNSPEGDRLNKEGEIAQGEWEEVEAQLKSKAEKIKGAMISQVISWKVD